ncbi:MAG: Tfp pilus assembly protein PilF, partial [Solidesulfovibrio magneticus str. Maddingley MBC34]
MPRHVCRLTVACLALCLALCLGLAAGCQKQPGPPPTPPPAPTAGQRLDAARQAVLAGDCARALPELETLPGELPQSGETFLLLGLCRAKQGQPDRAEAALAKASSLEPDNPRPLEALGILRYGQGRRPEAREALGKAAELKSTNPQTYYYLGNIAMQAGQCSQALDYYRMSMVKDPAFGDAFKEYRAAAAACAKSVRPAVPPPGAAPKKPAVPAAAPAAKKPDASPSAPTAPAAPTPPKKTATSPPA